MRIKCEMCGQFSAVVIVLLMLAMTSGCTGPANRDRGNSISVQPCFVPCWYGIIPGKTSLDEALQILDSVPGVHLVSEQELDDGRLFISWYRGSDKGWWIAGMRPDAPARSNLVVEGEIVIGTVIALAISDSLTLGEIVEHYGPPEAYATFHIRGMHTDEPDYWTVHLYYPQRGFMVRAKLPMQEWGYIRPDFEIATWSSFFPPTTMEGYFGMIESPYPGPDLKEWRGFGEVSK